MIGMRNFGNNGRLGNMLFQYASLCGISLKNNTNVLLPDSSIRKYLKYEYNIGQLNTRSTKKEDSFSYEEVNIENNHYDLNFTGYFQSYKYFELINKELFSFKQEYLDKADKILSTIPYKNKIAIHIRRGDYVDNPNYVLLPPTYYITALLKHFPDYKDYGIVIFSDDIPYCKVHFQCLENVYFSEGNSDIEDLILMSRCNHFIISNSSYSWWGSYLGEKEDTKIIRPKHHFAGKLLETHDIKDLYPEHWIVHDHLEEKLDLTDCTFVIPVKYDHIDRKKNLDLTVCMLQKDFNTNIVVGEQGDNKFNYMPKFGVIYHQFMSFDVFHRTKMLNIMIKVAHTPIVVNYDADVIIPPLQMYLAIEAIRNGQDMVYPYDGKFNRMPRETWFSEIEKRLDIGFVKNTVFVGSRPKDNLNSVGGCVLFNRQKFLEGGMENENFISFSDEDNERAYRFSTLGYKVKRIKGCLYHIDHWCGVDSSTKNPHWKKGRELWNKIKEMNKEELLTYIKENFTWKT